MHRRGPDAIEPRSPVLGARRGERRARDLLGIETARGSLRRVLADGEGARQGLGGVLVAKAGDVAKRVFLHAHSRGRITFSSGMKLLMRPMKRAPSPCSALASGAALARSIAARSSYQVSATPSTSTSGAGIACPLHFPTIPPSTQPP